MKVLDLFCGTGSATKAFEDRGHEVIGLDIINLGKTNIEMDIRQFAAHPETILDSIKTGWRPNVIWASPPCQCFSVGGVHAFKRRWQVNEEPDPFYGPRTPIHEESIDACEFVLATIRIIEKLKPKFWWIENPMGGLKTMGFMNHIAGPVVITYCQYGDTRMKPTCLWGIWPKSWNPRPRCKNGDPCHERAPRGSALGTQGLKNATLRAMIPYELGLEICEACENELL